MKWYRCLLGFLLIASVAVAGSERAVQPKPVDSVEAAKQGRALVEEILAQAPTKNFTNTGVLKIRDAQGKQTEVDVWFNIFVTPTNWLNSYSYDTSARSETVVPFETLGFTIVHRPGRSNVFLLKEGIGYGSKVGSDRYLTDDERVISSLVLTRPFAGSDFWLCDLALDFFHWPEQKLLKSELRKSRLCRVLESVNPQPTTNSYSRVVSWIDDETLGIIHAEAYDSQNKLLKEFDTKKFKKVKGEWQLEEMEISNVQTDSRSQIEFDLAK